MFLGKGILKICSKFTGEHPCQCFFQRKLLRSFLVKGFYLNFLKKERKCSKILDIQYEISANAGKYYKAFKGSRNGLKNKFL